MDYEDPFLPAKLIVGKTLLIVESFKCWKMM